MRNSVLMTLLVILAAAFTLFAGCDGADDGASDDATNADSVSEYRNTVNEMQGVLQMFHGESNGDYYAGMTDHLDRLATLRHRIEEDHMDSDMTDMMMGSEQDCREELDYFMEICLDQADGHEGHMDHTANHAELMGDLLHEMDEHCDEMMNDDHGHGDGDHMGGDMM